MDEVLNPMERDTRQEADLHAPLLKCQGVSKYFGALAAVKELDFQVKSDEVLGIGGPNGAGKSTLFDVISGLNPCSSGQVVFAGENIEGRSSHEICHLGLARTFQLNVGFDTLTARENLLTSRHYGRANRGFPGYQFDRETIDKTDEVIEFVGLEEYANRQARLLPVFRRKSLMIAGALATDPKLLLLDEPVGGLNPAEIDGMFELVERIRARGITLIVIEHVMRFLLKLSDRVMILHHGEKIFEGLPGELTSNKQVVEVFLGSETARRLQANPAAD